MEVYGIIAHILGLDPADTDGNLSKVSEIFATPGRTSWGLSISPDGESVLYTQRVPEEADIMIVDEFR